MSNKLLELRGNGRDATTTGTISQGKSGGNGATFAIDYIAGSSTSSVSWPSGSIPAMFTVCSVTRYTGDSNLRILQGSTGVNWVHGHDGGKRGIEIVYDGLIATYASVGTLTDWLVQCAKNDPGSVSGNVLVDGVASGIRAGSNCASGSTLNINVNGQGSGNFAFSSVVIWSGLLTDAQMVTASSTMMGIVKNQQIQSCSTCEVGKYGAQNGAAAATTCVSCPANSNSVAGSLYCTCNAGYSSELTSGWYRVLKTIQ